jgi:small GTP-binding protein
MAERDYDYMFKIIIIGESGTGKSCILHYLLESRFKRNQNHTVGVEFGCKHLEIAGKRIKLQIWDTAGQERFRSVTKSYYRGAAAAVLVYDITNTETFSKLTSWINDAKALSSQDISMIVLGNKNDLAEARAVRFVDAAGFCTEQNLQLLETSAVTGENIEVAFSKVAKIVLDKLQDGQLQDFKGIQPGGARIIDRTCNC